MSTWSCDRCTFVNRDLDALCSVCEGSRAVYSLKNLDRPRELEASASIKYVDYPSNYSGAASARSGESISTGPSSPVREPRDVINLCSPDPHTNSHLYHYQSSANIATLDISTAASLSPSLMEGNLLSSDRCEVTSRAYGDEFCISGIVDAIMYRVNRNNRTSLMKSAAHMCMRDCQHISQIGAHGASWSCGYRNIQMLASSVRHLPEYRACLLEETGGALPSVLQIQLLIGHAWKRGFDVEGAEQLGHKISGTCTKIGATECVVFFRSFGLRANLVDFVGLNFDPECGSKKRRRRNTSEEDIFLGLKLGRWIYEYFTQERFRWTSNCDASGRASCPPLFLQHDGHSRTIIGCISESIGPSDALLANDAILNLVVVILDPGQKHEKMLEAFGSDENSNLADSLTRCRVFDLVRNKTAFQIVYLREGFMSEEEQERSKVLTSERP